MDPLIITIVLTIITGIVLVVFIVLMILQSKSKPSNDIESRARNQQELLSKIENLKSEVAKEMELMNNKSQSSIKEELNTFREMISKTVTTDMSEINEKVENRLKEGFKSSNELFDEITKRLAVIDTTQKNIVNLATNVDELSRLLSDKKLRGMYGEGQLYHILDNVFGTSNTQLYEKQKKLSNNSLVDALVMGPDGIGNISVDSKFPLENYLLMNSEKATSTEREKATKDFKINIKTHIDDIANKYIIKGETADQAIMFIPSESVFAEISAQHYDLIEYSQKKHVWITSPTTLVYMLMMILVLSKNVEREKNAEKIMRELQALSDDFRRLFERWEDHKKAITRLSGTSDLLDITVNKLDKKVYKIQESEFDKIKESDDVE